MGHITDPPPAPPQGRGAVRLSHKAYKAYKTYKSYMTYKPYMAYKSYMTYKSSSPLWGTEGDCSTTVGGLRGAWRGT